MVPGPKIAFEPNHTGIVGLPKRAGAELQVVETRPDLSFVIAL